MNGSQWQAVRALLYCIGSLDCAGNNAAPIARPLFAISRPLSALFCASIELFFAPHCVGKTCFPIKKNENAC